MFKMSHSLINLFQTFYLKMLDHNPITSGETRFCNKVGIMGKVQGGYALPNSSVRNQRWAQARYCWRVMAEHYWKWSPLRKASTVNFSRWLGDRAFQSTIVLGKNENLKTSVRLDKVKNQELSIVELVERDGWTRWSSDIGDRFL